MIDRGVEHQRARPLDFLGELHVGDDEPEVVLGLEQRADADVADDDREERRDDRLADIVRAFGGKNEAERRLDGDLEVSC